MLLAFLLAVSAADWVPSRWPSGDPASLDLLSATPVNCLLLERKNWSSALSAKASERGVTVLGVLHPEGNESQSIRTAKEQGLRGIVFEGTFPDSVMKDARQLAASLDLISIELPSRRGIRFDGESKTLGTNQGVWPGIQPVDEKDAAHAMPSGGPWIDTNSGFLRYARAMHKGEFWLSVAPPAKQAIPIDRYFGAIADAAMVGARWVVALDDDLSARLFQGDAAAVRDWKRIAKHLQFYEDHREVRALPAYGQLAVVQDASNGALLSGGVLDMISVKHTPIRAVPGERLSLAELGKASMAVNVDPASLTQEQKNVLVEFSRNGGTVLNGPAAWKMPAESKNQITVDKDDVEKLDAIWKEMNGLINRRNLGVRLFNVSSMLSYLQASGDERRALLHLVNYSGFAVENVTAHVLGRYRKARIFTPEGKEKTVETYDVEEGVATGVDIDAVLSVALVVLEK